MEKVCLPSAGEFLVPDQLWEECQGGALAKREGLVRSCFSCHAEFCHKKFGFISHLLCFVVLWSDAERFMQTNWEK